MVIKVVLIILIIVISGYLIYWVSTRNINSEKTFKKLTDKVTQKIKKPIDFIEEIDKNAIYQDGEIIATTVGEIQEDEKGNLLIKKVYNEGLSQKLVNLKKDDQFNYRNETYEIVSIGNPVNATQNEYVSNGVFRNQLIFKK